MTDKKTLDLASLHRAEIEAYEKDILCSHDLDYIDCGDCTPPMGQELTARDYHVAGQVVEQLFRLEGAPGDAHWRVESVIEYRSRTSGKNRDYLETAIAVMREMEYTYRRSGFNVADIYGAMPEENQHDHR